MSKYKIRGVGAIENRWGGIREAHKRDALCCTTTRLNWSFVHIISLLISMFEKQSNKEFDLSSLTLLLQFPRYYTAAVAGAVEMIPHNTMCPFCFWIPCDL